MAKKDSAYVFRQKNLSNETLADVQDEGGRRALYSHIINDENPNEWSRQSFLEGLERCALERLSFEILHSRPGQGGLLLAEVKHSGVEGTVGHSKETPDGTRDIDHAAHDEQPTPASKSVDAIEACIHARLKVAREHVCREGCRVENTRSSTEF
jgi:hypothetical protein